MDTCRECSIGVDMENFDEMAESYDTPDRIERSKMFADEFSKYIIDSEYKTAVEFGCGTGLVGLELINYFKSFIFIDSSSNMINFVEQKLVNSYKGKAQALCLDLSKTFLVNLSVDYIFSSLVLHHINDTKLILTNLYNLLNKNGKLLIIDVDTDDGNFHAHRTDFEGHNGYEHSYLVDLCKSVGFSDVKIKTFYYSYRIVDDIEKTFSFLLCVL